MVHACRTEQNLGKNPSLYADKYQVRQELLELGIHASLRDACDSFCFTFLLGIYV